MIAAEGVSVISGIVADAAPHVSMGTKCKSSY